MDVIIREMLVKDIDEILEIEKESFSTPWSKEAFITEIKKNLLAKYLVAELEERVVGYGGMWLILNESHVTNIAVRKAYRGMGVGKQILEEMISYCDLRDIGHMTLEVRKSNIIAQGLYKQYGFIEYGVREEYYADNKEDAIIMWRRSERGDLIC